MIGETQQSFLLPGALVTLFVVALFHLLEALYPPRTYFRFWRLAWTLSCAYIALAWLSVRLEPGVWRSGLVFGSTLSAFMQVLLLLNGALDVVGRPPPVRLRQRFIQALALLAAVTAVALPPVLGVAPAIASEMRRGLVHAALGSGFVIASVLLWGSWRRQAGSGWFRVLGAACAVYGVTLWLEAGGSATQLTDMAGPFSSPVLFIRLMFVAHVLSLGGVSLSMVGLLLDEHRRVEGLARKNWEQRARVSEELEVRVGERTAALKVAERAASKAVRRFRGLFDATPDALLLCDRDGLIAVANAAVKSLLGYDPAELAGRRVELLMPEAARLRHEKHRAVYLTDPRRRSMGDGLDLRARRKDGSEIPVFITLNPIETEDGWFVLATVRDGTERRQSERRRSVAEAELRRVINSIPDYLWSAKIDESGTFRRRYYSDKVELVTGYPVEFYMRDSARWLTTVHPDDRQRVKQTFESFVSRLTAQEEQEYRVVRPDGTVRWLHDRMSVRRTEEGIVHLDGVVSDITDRKEAEAGRLEAEGRARMLLESVFDGIVLSASDGGIRYANEAVFKMFGYASREELASHQMSDLFAPGDRERARHRGETQTSGDAPYVSEYRGIRKEGSIFPVEIISRPAPDGEETGLLDTIRDISERRVSEERLRRAQKMEAVAQLAGGVAHDFNNLLTIIQGYADIQLKRLDAKDPLRRSAEKIRRATDQAAAVSRRLLEFSRRQVVQPTVLNVNAVISEFETVLHRLAAGEVQFSTRLDPQVKPVLADRGQIEQVLLNLVLNARDAMPDGGELTIASDNVELSEQFLQHRLGLEPGAYVRVTVTDTGVGISDETLPHIFEPFFTTKGMSRGTGLGLATVYGIINDAGGEIEVQSQIGIGTTLSIYLPSTAEQDRTDASSAPGEVTAGPRFAAACVLVVEDQEDVRTLVCDLLKEAGHHVLEAADGVDALRLVDSHAGAIDLLVADVVMPGMSGRELAGRLTSLRPTLKVLYISGYTPDEVLRHGVRSQETSLLQKPFTLEELANKIDTLLGRGTQTQH